MEFFLLEMFGDTNLGRKGQEIIELKYGMSVGNVKNLFLYCLCYVQNEFRSEVTSIIRWIDAEERRKWKV